MPTADEPRITVRLSKRLYVRLSAEAKSAGIPLGQLVRQRLEGPEDVVGGAFYKDAVEKGIVEPEKHCPLAICPTKSTTLKSCPIHGHLLV